MRVEPEDLSDKEKAELVKLFLEWLENIVKWLSEQIEAFSKWLGDVVGELEKEIKEFEE